MHTATIHKDPHRWAGQVLKPGRYWLEDHNAAELMHSSGGWGNITLERRDRPVPVPVRECDDITVVRVGGFGDLLWCNAIYDELKRRHPSLTITHACFDYYKDVLLGYADRVISYPLAELPPARETSLWWLENVIEGKPCRGTEHPCDRLAALFGLDPLEKKAAYHLTDKERTWASKQWRKRHPDRFRIGVQLESSGQAKSYRSIGRIMQALTNSFCDLVTVGPPDPPTAKRTVPENVYHCPGHRHTIRESIAMISTCDAILAPDSVFTHVGAALDIPVVGLYGPFEGAAYMVGQRGTAIQGALRCSPCHHHPRGQWFPPEGPCNKSGVCDALEAVEPRQILKEVLAWAEEGRKSKVSV